MIKRILYAVLSLALVVGCERDNVDEYETPYLELGGDTLDDVVLNPYWDWADAWPGAVGSTLERVDSVEVVVVGGYSAHKYDVANYPLQSTGYYLATLETAVISVPIDFNVDNLYCQIGMGHALYDYQFRERYNDVTSQHKLERGNNEIVSYFGGYVYIYYDESEGSIPSESVTLTLNNVIKSPDYVYGVTDMREWYDLIYLDPVYDDLLDTTYEAEILPYMEIRSDEVILTIGTEEVISESLTPSEYIESLIAYTNTMLKFGGYDDLTGQLPVRIHTDLQIPDSTQTDKTSDNMYYGYSLPLTITRNEKQEIYILDEDVLRNGAYSTAAAWYNHYYMFVELFMNGWSEQDADQNMGISERTLLKTPLMHTAVYYNSYMGYNEAPFASDPYSLSTAVTTMNEGRLPINKYDDSLFRCDITDYPQYMSISSGITDDQRAVALLQLIKETGWGLISYVNGRSNDVGFVNDTTMFVDNFDFLAMCASEYRNINMLPFFEYWRIPVSAVAGEYINGNFDPLEKSYTRQNTLTGVTENCYFFEQPFTASELSGYNAESQYTPKVGNNPPFPAITYDIYSYTALNELDVNKTSRYFKYHIGQATDAISADYTKNYDDETPGDGSIEASVDDDYSTSFLSANLSASAWTYNITHNDWDASIEGSTTNEGTNWQYLSYVFTGAIDVNTLQIATTSADGYLTSSICHIEYLPEDADHNYDANWISTYPNEFIMVDDATTRKYNYYFMENYKAQGIRFVIRPSASSSKVYASISEFSPAYIGSVDEIFELNKR